GEGPQVQLLLGPVLQARGRNALRRALLWVLLLSPRRPVPEPGRDLDQHLHAALPHREPLEPLRGVHVLVHHHPHNCGLRRHARRQLEGDALHHLLHALQSRPHRLPHRQHDQPRRPRHQPHQEI
ncbi:hypothetical protein CFC21_024233, partial [Triticum aestivum]